MKLHKKIIIISLVIIIMSGGCTFFLDSNIKLYDICVGIFSSAFLTLITTTIFYFYEKNRMLNKIYDKFSEVYFALCNLDKFLGEFLLSKEVTDIKFSTNYMLTREIVDIAYSFSFEEYNSFYAKNMDQIINNLINLKIKFSNLNKLAGERAKSILTYEIMLKEIEQKRMLGFSEQALVQEIQSTKEHRENILILIGKLHECSVSLKLELDELLTSLDKLYKFICKWNIKKQYFDNEIKLQKING